jgi:predicted MFS family arabinose efflux permease
MSLMSVYQILVPTLPLYLKRLGSTEIEVGMLIGAMGVASVLARPVVGKLLTRAGAKVFMIVGACLSVIVNLAYLVIPPFWPFLLVRILHGAGFGFFHTASTSYVVGITKPAYRARALGYFALTMNFAGTIAPPLGVILLNGFGARYLFLVCTAISLCMLTISAVLGRSPTASKADSEAEGSLICLSAVPHSIVGFMALWVWASMTTFFPIYATNQGVANPGLFFTAIAVTLIVSRVLGGKILDVPNKKMLVLLCLATSILSMVVLSLSRTQPMFLLSAVIWGAGHAYLLPSLITLALHRAESSPSSVVATFYAISDVGVFVGPLVMGVVVHYTSYPIMFFCLSLVALANLLYFWWFSASNQ